MHQTWWCIRLQARGQRKRDKPPAYVPEWQSYVCQCAFYLFRCLAMSQSLKQLYMQLLWDIVYVCNCLLSSFHVFWNRLLAAWHLENAIVLLLMVILWQRRMIQFVSFKLINDKCCYQSGGQYSALTSYVNGCVGVRCAFAYVLQTRRDKLSLSNSVWSRLRSV